mmetsp:Transcript_7520/g.25559  ORF Transcript_7520/g.25559 Transcript_7520/m.25559 type:complete len:240 (-) Transcript_7520:333-1052(-)
MASRSASSSSSTKLLRSLVTWYRAVLSKSSFCLSSSAAFSSGVAAPLVACSTYTTSSSPRAALAPCAIFFHRLRSGRRPGDTSYPRMSTQASGAPPPPKCTQLAQRYMRCCALLSRHRAVCFGPSGSSLPKDTITDPPGTSTRRASAKTATGSVSMPTAPPLSSTLSKAPSSYGSRRGSAEAGGRLRLSTVRCARRRLASSSRALMPRPVTSRGHSRGSCVKAPAQRSSTRLSGLMCRS